MKKHNFSAGPSILANEVITQAAKSVKEIDDFGLSILEISHRSNQFVDIMNTAQKLVKDLLNISDDYAVLFLQGGASLQFYMSSLNFLKPNGKAGYIDTGTWSQKAIQEAKKNGATVIVASSKEKNYSFIPKNIKLKEKIDYLHFTSNNTIYGGFLLIIHPLNTVFLYKFVIILLHSSSSLFLGTSINGFTFIPNCSISLSTCSSIPCNF